MNLVIGRINNDFMPISVERVKHLLLYLVNQRLEERWNVQGGMVVVTRRWYYPRIRENTPIGTTRDSNKRYCRSLKKPKREKVAEQDIKPEMIKAMGGRKYKIPPKMINCLWKTKKKAGD